jgi:transposase
MLPMGLGYVEGITHDYKRHGTSTLFAALNVLNGAVLVSCKPRPRHQEYLAFLREIERAVPAELDIRSIADNYATHNHPKVNARLAAHPRWTMHFIPTYSSWLKQVERFFGMIIDKAIRRGSFTSVKQLVQRIDHFVAAYNTNCCPFKWTATADSILEKLHRFCTRIPGQDTSVPVMKLAQAAQSDAQWHAFVRAYRREMAAPDAAHSIALLAALSARTDFALGCYCADETRCHRSILRELLRDAGAVFAPD